MEAWPICTIIYTIHILKVRFSERKLNDLFNRDKYISFNFFLIIYDISIIIFLSPPLYSILYRLTIIQRILIRRSNYNFSAITSSHFITVLHRIGRLAAIIHPSTSILTRRKTFNTSCFIKSEQVGSIFDPRTYAVVAF